MMESSSEAIFPEPSPAEIEIAKWKPLIKKHDVCRMHVKKYKVTKNTDIDKLFHRTNVEKSVFYKTEGRISPKSPKFRDKFGYELILNETNKSELHKDQSTTQSNRMPADLLEHLHEKQDEGKQSSIRGKYRYSCTASNICDRLFIPEKLEESLQGITDVDKTYFSIVQERKKISKFSRKKYLVYLRETLRLRLQTGYIYDELYRLNEQSEIHKNNSNRIISSLKEYKLAFDEFLAEDHDESMVPLLLYGEEVTQTENKRNSLIDNLLEISDINYRVNNLEDFWRNGKRCEEFLLAFFSILSGNNSSYYLQMKYGSDYNLSYSEQSSVTSCTSLTQFEFRKIINDDLGINLEDPLYLLQIFKSLEHQCLDYLTFIELLEKRNMVASLHLDLITRFFEDEISFCQQNIIKLDSLFTLLEQNNNKIETNLHCLLNGMFKENFDGAEENIIIDEYVKQAYIKCAPAMDSFMTTESMIKGLALQYKTLLLEMDDLAIGFLRNVIRTVEDRENVRLVFAIDARRRLKEMENFMKQVSRSFNPVNINKGRKLMPRSAPRTMKAKTLSSYKGITKEEKEYLLLFTEYCQYTDDPEKYLSKEKPF